VKARGGCSFRCPSAAGKTVVFAALPAFFKMQKRMLVLAHREELLEQAAA
jgi:superfamily II DNA or RNA helicase